MTDPVLSPPSLSSGPLFGLPLPEVWFALVFATLAVFLFLDGFDFGVGALFSTRTDPEDRELFLAAVGPFWDGNEVWLVVFGGALFAAFPGVYASLFSRYYLLMFAILLALGLRGLAPEFYEQVDDDRWRRAWGWAFVVGSVAAPFFIGLFAGDWLVGAEAILTVPGVVVGLLVVSLTLVEGVAYLTVKLRGPLRAEVSRFALPALGAYVGLLVLTVLWIAVVETALRPALRTPVGVGLVLASVAFAVAYAATMWWERHLAGLVAAAGLDASLVALVAVLLYPTVDPVTGTTVREAIVPTVSLNLMTVVAGAVLPFVLVYFVVLYTVFRGPVTAETAY